MATKRHQTSFFLSIIGHVFIVLMLVLGFEFSSPLPVVENTNKNDIISAVVLGDTAKSKILPQKAPAEPVKQIVKEEPKQKPIEQVQVKKDVIALADKQALAAKAAKEIFAKDLLADIKKQADKQKKLKQKQLKSSFEKTLREQAEKSLRQQLMNEDIKLQGKETREAHGVVDKYKALIIQAISEHWIVPPGANKKLYAELMIRLAPGGVVLDVQVTKSSGDLALDGSARAAVMKASPLPVPSDLDEFKPFSQFVLRVKPENVLASDGGLSAG